MINGHESITFELSDKEIKLAHKLIGHFKNRTKENPVKSNEIVAGVNRVFNMEKKFTDVRLRKIINYYRVNSIIPIISTSKGYYVSYDKQEIVDMINSLDQRASSILNCSKGLNKFIQS